MINDHVYRSLPHKRDVNRCAYMNCRRPAAEHERVMSPSAVRAAANRR